MIVFFLSAGGSFLGALLPLDATECTLAMALVAFAYTLLGGLYGVIWTDVFQAALIGLAAVYVSVRAASVVSPELTLAWPGAELNSFIPRLSDERLVPYESFWFFLVVWSIKGVLEGLGGSAGSAYMAQRFYAARSEADTRKIGMLWTILFAVRWPMVLGFAVLAMHLGIDARTVEDAEQILPQVLMSDLFPTGIRGLMVAALLAAAMSTFDSTINAGGSYVVRDLYGPLRPAADQRELVIVGYVASALLVATGLAVSFSLRSSALGIWLDIVMLLFPAFLIPFALRFFWWRFTGEGFAAGVVAGFAAALYLRLVTPESGNEATRFLIIAGISLSSCLIATFASRPTDRRVLEDFYRRIRPWGIWPRAFGGAHESEHKRDLTLLFVALAWQLLTFLIPMGMVLGMWRDVAVAAALWLALTIPVWRAAFKRSARESDAVSPTHG